LPEGVVLKDLGEGGLKDLVRAEHVYQLVASDLPADFPPLKSLDDMARIGKLSNNDWQEVRSRVQAAVGACK
jgi:hypothetical protein